MEIRPRVLLDRPLSSTPKVTLILLDWCVRESFHVFDYLAAQDVPREQFEVLWIEYYDRAPREIASRIEAAGARGQLPPVDRWIVMNMPRTAYYHKHLMYNVGILASRGDLVMIGDSDAMVKPTFVRSLLDAFAENPDIVLHLDEVRSHSRRFYPFNYPTFEQLLAGECINWDNGETTGLRDTLDPLHTRNYGACICARRDDVIAIGGADEHVDYLGHVCGPYDLTWRLVNFGRREVWHRSEFLWHAWHPGSDGDENYLGPHDGRNVSTLALQARRNRRIPPLVENAVLRTVRESGALPQESLEITVARAIGERALTEWVIDDMKRAVSGGRAAWSARRHADAIALWEPLRNKMAHDAKFVSDLAWSYYFCGRHADALAAFDESLRIADDNPDAWRGRAWTLAVVGRHADALDAYNRAIAAADPIDSFPLQEAYRGRGWAHFHLAHYPAAQDDFAAALQRTPKEDVSSLQDLHRGLGWVLLKKGDAAGAAAAFTAALEALGDRRGSEWDDASNGLAQARAAISLPSLVHESVPRSNTADVVVADVRRRIASRLRADLGWTHFKRSQYVQAQRLFKEALTFDPHNARALSGASWTALRLGQYHKAQASIERLLKQDLKGDPQTKQEALRARAWLLFYRGLPDKALENFDRALRFVQHGDVGTMREIRRGRSRSYFLMGERRRALEEWTASDSGSRIQFVFDMYRSRLRTLLSAPGRRKGEGRQ